MSRFVFAVAKLSVVLSLLSYASVFTGCNSPTNATVKDDATTEEETFTVTFVDNTKGVNFEPQTVVTGGNIEEPEQVQLRGFLITGWSLDTAGSNLWDFDTQVIDDVTLYAQWEYVEYSIGDVGPAGGWIFHDNSSWETDGWRYLEAAPSSTEWMTKRWGGEGTSLVGTGTAIGTGLENTAAIVLAYGSVDPYWLRSDYAAKLAFELSWSGYDDWFLPSIYELELIYERLYIYNMGNFGEYSYWSSSENGVSDVWYYGFYNGGVKDYVSKKYGSYPVRAIRAF